MPVGRAAGLRRLPPSKGGKGGEGDKASLCAVAGGRHCSSLSAGSYNGLWVSLLV